MISAHTRVLSLALAMSLSAVNNLHAEPSHTTVGPLGNPATAASEIHLSAQERDILHKKSPRAALVWHGSSNWVNALSRGAKDTFSELGIEVVAETDAQFDPARQASDIESIMALKPDIILTLAIDSISAANSYRAAVDGGVKLVLLSNPIEGYQAGRDYVGIVTDDMHGMGVAAAHAIADAVGGAADIGVIFHDADYFITNNRDKAFIDSIESGKPGLEKLTIASRKGFNKESETSNIAAAMVLQKPSIKAIYVAWDSAAEGVIEGLRSMGRGDVKVITHDLGVNNLVDMATDGSLYATIADRPYEIGHSMAKLGAYGILNKPAPAFSIVSFDTVKKSDIPAAWQKTYRQPPPKILMQATTQNTTQ